MPKSKPLFTDSDMRQLRRLYYEQAPTIAALIQSTYETDYTPQQVANETVELIEALCDAVGEVTEDGI